ncbi:DUF4197 domain-containing protein [Polaromonas sp. P1(28)-13]|nr:DUF4197 domain-containing protein [Polaromonas sp. P1(28)-13]
MGKALNGLYLVIGEEEKKIRQDSVATGTPGSKRCLGCCSRVVCSQGLVKSASSPCGVCAISYQKESEYRAGLGIKA